MPTKTKEKAQPNRTRFQRVISDIEWKMDEEIAADPFAAFNKLCADVARSDWAKKMKLGNATEVRGLILSMEMETECKPAPVVTFDNMWERIRMGRPFSVCYGMGVDSTALLIHLARLYNSQKNKRPQFRPTCITFADTGSEKKETYAYEPVIQDYLKQMGFPPVVTVRYKPSPDRVKNGWYHTLEQQCLVNRTLPSWAFKRKKCSAKWKIGPQNKYRESLDEFQTCWDKHYQGIVAIGYDASPNDSRRSFKITDDQLYQYWYPLIELGWDRQRCLEEIRKEGLPGWSDHTGRKWIKKGGVPVKSACWFCPSTTAEELELYSQTEHGRDYLRAIVRMEDNCQEQLQVIEGLWGHRTKHRSGRMADFIQTNGLIDGMPSLPIIDQFEFQDCEQCAGCF